MATPAKVKASDRRKAEQRRAEDKQEKSSSSQPAVLQPTITVGEQRIELQLEGVKSVLSGRFLSLGETQRRNHKEVMANHTEVMTALNRIAVAVEKQNDLVERQFKHSNGHAKEADETPTAQGDSGREA